MRHRKNRVHLSRTGSHRKAMFRNMAVSLIENEVIRTTLPKAKALRRVVEPLITLAKEDTIAHRRLAYNRLRNEDIVNKLFTVIGVKSKSRLGGYLRILKNEFRTGDVAPMAIVEWVDR